MSKGKKDKSSHLEGNNVITKYTVPTSPGSIFKHRKEQSKSTSIADTTKASSSRNMRSILIVSDSSDSDSETLKGEAIRQNLRRAKSTKTPVLKHVKKTVKDIRCGFQIYSVGSTQTWVASRENDSQAPFTQISDSPVSTIGSTETLNSDNPVSSRHRPSLVESTSSPLSPSAAPVLRSVTLTPTFGAVVQSQKNKTPLTCGDERRSQKLFQSAPHKDKAETSYPRQADAQKARNGAEMDYYYRAKDTSNRNLVPQPYQHLRDISGRRQLHGMHRICSSEAVRPMSVICDDRMASADRLLKRLKDQETRQGRKSHDTQKKSDNGTNGEPSESEKILKHKHDPVSSVTLQRTGSVKNSDLVKSCDLKGLSQGGSVKTTTSESSNGGRQTSGKNSALDRTIDDFVNETNTTNHKTNKVFTDVSNNRTNNGDNQQEIGRKTTKKTSCSSSSNSTRSSPTFLPKRQRKNSFSSETSGFSTVFNLQDGIQDLLENLQDSDSENDPGSSKYEAANSEHSTNSTTPSQDCKFSDKNEPRAYGFGDSSQEAKSSEDSGPSHLKKINISQRREKSLSSAITPPVVSGTSDFFPASSSQSSHSSKTIVGSSAVLTSTSQNVAESSNESAENELTANRTRNFLEVERDDKRRNTILDSVLSDAKKKSKEKRLAALGSPVSRRLAGLASGPSKHRSMRLADQDHPLNKMLKSYSRNRKLPTDTSSEGTRPNNPNTTVTNNATSSTTGVAESKQSSSKYFDTQNKPSELTSQIIHTEDVLPVPNVLRADKIPGKSAVTVELSPPNAPISSWSNSHHGKGSRQEGEVVDNPTAPASLNKNALKDSAYSASSQVDEMTPSSEAELRSKVEDQIAKSKDSEVAPRSRVMNWPRGINFPKLTLKPIFTVTLKSSGKASRVTGSGTVMSQSSTTGFNVTKAIASNSVMSQSKPNINGMQKVLNPPRETASVKLMEGDSKSRGDISHEPCSRNSESEVIDLALTDGDVAVVAQAKVGDIMQSSKDIISPLRDQSARSVLGVDKPQGLIGAPSKLSVSLTKDLKTSLQNPEVTKPDQGPVTDGGTVPLANPDIYVERNPVPSNLDTPRPRGEDLTTASKDKPGVNGSQSEQALLTETRTEQVQTGTLQSDIRPSNGTKEISLDNQRKASTLLLTETRAEQVQTRMLRNDLKPSNGTKEISLDKQLQASTSSESYKVSISEIFDEFDDAMLSDDPAATSDTEMPDLTVITALDDGGLDYSENDSIPAEVGHDATALVMDTADHMAAVIDENVTCHDKAATDQYFDDVFTQNMGHDVTVLGMDTTDHVAAAIDESVTGHDNAATDQYSDDAFTQNMAPDATSLVRDTTDHMADVINKNVTGHDDSVTDQYIDDVFTQDMDMNMDMTEYEAITSDLNSKNLGDNIFEVMQDDFVVTGDEAIRDDATNQDTGTTSKNFCAKSVSPTLERDYEATTTLLTSDDLVASSVVQTNEHTSEFSEAEKQGSKSLNISVPVTGEEAVQSSKSIETKVQGSKVDGSKDFKTSMFSSKHTSKFSEAAKQGSKSVNISVPITGEEAAQSSESIENKVQGSKAGGSKDFKTSMFDISQFFDDDDNDDDDDDDDDDDFVPDQLSDTELEMPELLQEDKMSALRQNCDNGADDTETTIDEDNVEDELLDPTDTARAKRRRLTDKEDAAQKTTLAQREEMMLRPLESIFTTNQSPPGSVTDSDWIKEMDDIVNMNPGRTRNPRKRPRSTDQPSTLKAEPSLTEILADTAFSRCYKIHGPSLKKLVREKKRDAEVDRMEEMLLLDLKNGGFRKTLEEAEHGDEDENMECDEDTKKAFNLMRKDWGTLPVLPFSGKIFQSKRLKYCVHKMELKSCFDARSLEGLTAKIRTVVLRLSAANIFNQSGYVNFLLSQPKTRMQTYKWLLDVLHCHNKCETVQDIIQSNLRSKKFNQSPFSYSQFKSALINTGVSESLFDDDHGHHRTRTRERVPEYSICEECTRRRQKTSARYVVSIAKVLSTVSHLYIGFLTESKQVETTVFLLLLLQERNIRRIDVMEITGLLLKELTNWESQKYLIIRRLLEVCTRLNTHQAIAMRLHFNGERPHELSRILSSVLFKVHIFGDEPQTMELDDFDDLEALVEVVDYFNPENLEALLVAEGTEGQIGSQKQSYYHLSLLLPLLNICIGDKCEDETVFTALDRIWTILRSMNKSIRDNGAIYRSQVKYELSLFTKHLRILIQKAPKKNKASIFKYLRSAPVKEELVGNTVGQSGSSDESSDENELSYNDENEEVRGQVAPKSTRIVAELDDEFRIADVIKRRIIGSAGKD